MKLKFSGPDGLKYDVAVHDFVEEDGEIASAERVAGAWETTVEQVERDRAIWSELREKRSQPATDDASE